MAEQAPLYRKPISGFVNEAKRQRAIKELKDEYKVKESEAKAKGQKLPAFVLDETKVKELYLKFGGWYVPTAEEVKKAEIEAKEKAEAEAKAKAEAEVIAKAEEKARIIAEYESGKKGETSTEEAPHRGRPKKAEVTE